MRIEITRPEVEDIIFLALREFDANAKPDRSEANRFTSFPELLPHSPFAGAGLDLERTRDYPRTVEIE